MKELRELPVDEHEPALLVLHEYHGGGVVEDLVQARLAVLQRALHRARSRCPCAAASAFSATSRAMTSKARLSLPSSSRPTKTAAGAEIPGGELLRRSDQAGGAAREQKVEHQPHRERERGHPPGPVEGLPQHLRPASAFGRVRS